MENTIIIKNKKDVTNFLDEIKKTDFKLFKLIFRNNEKNPDNLLSEIGYDYFDLINEIKKLEVKDFLRCQIDSKNSFLMMYSFLKKIQKYIVYIKLAIVKKNEQNVYIISFHKAEKDELHLRPFREGKIEKN